MALCASVNPYGASARSCCCCCECACHSATSGDGAPGGPLVSPFVTQQRNIPTNDNSSSNDEVAASEFFAQQPCSRCRFGDERSCGQQPVCKCLLCCSCSCSAVPDVHLASLLMSYPLLSRLPMVSEEAGEELLAGAITEAGYQGNRLAIRQQLLLLTSKQGTRSLCVYR